METSTGGGILKGLGRALAGDTVFLNFYTAESDNQEIGFASGYPGKIIPLKLNGNTIIAQKHSYLASEEDVDISIHFKKKIGRGLFGGEGFILQKFTGNGMVFLEIDGEVLEYDLAAGESMLIDQGHLAAMESNMLIGGEGLFFGKLTGPGKVWIQTMPISKLADALLPFIPTTNGGDV